MHDPGSDCLRYLYLGPSYHSMQPRKTTILENDQIDRTKVVDDVNVNIMSS